VAAIGDKVCAGSTILARYRHLLGNHPPANDSADDPARGRGDTAEMPTPNENT
jgi:hypothetical protein